MHKELYIFGIAAECNVLFFNLVDCGGTLLEELTENFVMPNLLLLLFFLILKLTVVFWALLQLI